MAEKEIKVIINGEEHVSKAAKTAEEGVESFASKKDKWFKSFVDIKAAWDLIASAALKVAGVVRDSFDAYDELQASQLKLAGTSKITGTSLDELRAMSERAQKQFGLSTVTTNDLAIAADRLAQRTGQAVDKNKLLESVLNMGAARGLTATQSLESFERAIMGIDRGFDVLYGKNQSVIFEEYAKSIGTTVGKLTDMEKGQALVWATMDAGTKVGDAYSEFLKTAAGQQGQLNEKMKQAQASLGEVMLPLRVVGIELLSAFTDQLGNSTGALKGIMQSLAELVRVLGPPTQKVLEWFVLGVAAIATIAEQLIFTLQNLAYTTENRFGKMLVTIGTFVEKAGGMLKLFGIEAVAGMGESLKKSGQGMVDRTEKIFDELDVKYKDFQERTRKTFAKGADERAKDAVFSDAQITAAAEKAAGDRVAAAKSEVKTVKAVKDEAAAAEAEALKARAEEAKKAAAAMEKTLGEALRTSINGSADAILRIRDALAKTAAQGGPEMWQQFDEKSQGYLRTLELMHEASEVLERANHGLPPRDAAAWIGDIVAKLEEQAEAEKRLTGNMEAYRDRMAVVKGLKEDVVDLTEREVEATEAVGDKLDRPTRSTDAMSKSMESIASTSLDFMKAMGVVDDKAYSTLQHALNIQTAIGKIAGGDFTAGLPALIGAMGAMMSQITGGDAERKRLLGENNTQLARLRDEIGNLSLNVTGDDFSKVKDALSAIVPQLKADNAKNMPHNMEAVIKGLVERGMNFGDLEKVASAIGINLKDSKGNFQIDSLRQLLDALGLVEFGTYGRDFRSQMDFLRGEFDINKTSKAEQARRIAELGAQFSPVLAGMFNPNDLASSRFRLADLFARLNTGGVSAKEMGGLTGTQFADLVKSLIGMIDDIKSDSTSTAADTVSTDSAFSDTVSIPGVGTITGVSTMSFDQVIDAQTVRLESPLLSLVELNERTANATELSASELQIIRALIEQMSVSDFIGGLDAAFEQRRRNSAMMRGAPPFVD